MIYQVPGYVVVDALLEINNILVLDPLADPLNLAEIFMCIYLFGYDSAIEIYRRTGSKPARARRTEVDLHETSASIRELKATGWMDWFEQRVHLIVGSMRQQRDCTRFETHHWGTHCRWWPVLQVDEGVYVSSPEFVFLQMANVLDELSLIFLGCELCGRYYYEQGRIEERPQICSKERIAQFLKGHEGARGHKRAVRALRHVLDNSGSPMETELALRLTLPCRRGGRGIAKPELNRSIALGPVATAAYGRDWITPDLLWEKAKLAIEYESDEFHTGAERITNDSRRRLALETAGYNVITVTNAQLRNARDFDAIAESVARKTHKRRVRLGEAALAAQGSLAFDLHRLATDPQRTLCAA